MGGISPPMNQTIAPALGIEPVTKQSKYTTKGHSTHYAVFRKSRHGCSRECRTAGGRRVSVATPRHNAATSDPSWPVSMVNVNIGNSRHLKSLRHYLHNRTAKQICSRYDYSRSTATISRWYQRLNSPRVYASEKNSPLMARPFTKNCINIFTTPKGWILRHHRICFVFWTMRRSISHIHIELLVWISFISQFVTAFNNVDDD